MQSSDHACMTLSSLLLKGTELKCICKSAQHALSSTSQDFLIPKVCKLRIMLASLLQWWQYWAISCMPNTIGGCCSAAAHQGRRAANSQQPCVI